MAVTYNFPRIQHTDEYGTLLTEGRMWFYAAGTSLPKDVFYDEDLLVPAPNPLYAAADGRFPQVFLGIGKYKTILEKQTAYVAPMDQPSNWTVVPNTECDDIQGAEAPLDSTGAIFYVDTIAALKDATTSLGSVYVRNHTNIGDGGGGLYTWNGSSVVADDGGWYVQRTSGGAGRWIHTTQGTADGYDIRIWGAQSAGAVIDTILARAENVAATAGAFIVIPAGTWNVGGNHTFNSKVKIQAGAVFNSATSATMNFVQQTVVMGNQRIASSNVTLHFPVIASGVRDVSVEWFYDISQAKTSAATNSNRLVFNGSYLMPSGLISTNYAIDVPVLFKAGSVLDISASGAVSASRIYFNQGITVEDNSLPVFKLVAVTPYNTIVVKRTPVCASWFNTNGGTALQRWTAAYNAALAGSGVMRITSDANTIPAAIDMSGVDHIIDDDVAIVFQGNVDLGTIIGKTGDLEFSGLDTYYLSCKNLVINPRWFGTYTGSSAASTIMKTIACAARSAAKNGGRVVVDFSANTYTPTGSMNLVGTMGYVAGDTVNNIVIKGLRCYPSTASTITFSLTNTVTDVDLEDCYFLSGPSNGGNWGLNMGSWYGKATNCIWNGTAANGAVATYAIYSSAIAPYEYPQFSNCSFYGPGANDSSFQGIFCPNSNDITVSNCTFVNMGVGINAGRGKVDNCTFDTASVNAPNARYAMYFTGVSDDAINGYIHNCRCTNAAIKLDQPNYWTIDGGTYKYKYTGGTNGGQPAVVLGTTPVIMHDININVDYLAGIDTTNVSPYSYWINITSSNKAITGLNSPSTGNASKTTHRTGSILSSGFGTYTILDLGMVELGDGVSVSYAPSVLSVTKTPSDGTNMLVSEQPTWTLSKPSTAWQLSITDNNASAGRLSFEVIS
jgi:hypothetical protein